MGARMLGKLSKLVRTTQPDCARTKAATTAERSQHAKRRRDGERGGEGCRAADRAGGGWRSPHRQLASGWTVIPAVMALPRASRVPCTSSSIE